MAGLIRSNRRDPFASIARELFNNWDAPVVKRTASAFAPRFSVIENDEAFVAKADLPGVAEADIDVTLNGRELTISGKRDVEEKKEGENFHIYERSFGSFKRMFTLPETIDGDNISAGLKNGVLTVVIPKTPELQPRKIPVALSQ